MYVHLCDCHLFSDTHVDVFVCDCHVCSNTHVDVFVCDCHVSSDTHVDVFVCDCHVSSDTHVDVFVCDCHVSSDTHVDVFVCDCHVSSDTHVDVFVCDCHVSSDTHVGVFVCDCHVSSNTYVDVFVATLLTDLTLSTWTHLGITASWDRCVDTRHSQHSPDAVSLRPLNRDQCIASQTVNRLQYKSVTLLTSNNWNTSANWADISSGDVLWESQDTTTDLRTHNTDSSRVVPTSPLHSTVYTPRDDRNENK